MNINVSKKGALRRKKLCSKRQRNKRITGEIHPILCLFWLISRILSLENRIFWKNSEIGRLRKCPPSVAKGVFYKLRDKEHSKESAYVLVAFRFLARPFVSFVSRIARYAPSSTDKSSSLRNQKSTQPNFQTPLKSKRLRRKS